MNNYRIMQVNVQGWLADLLPEGAAKQCCLPAEQGCLAAKQGSLTAK